MTGLRSDQLERGKCYTLPGFIGPGYHTIRLEGIGPKTVRYRGWDEDTDTWSRVQRHPRILFNSWDGIWQAIEDPSP